jgi:hypothetical protein
MGGPEAIRGVPIGRRLTIEDDDDVRNGFPGAAALKILEANLDVVLLFTDVGLPSSRKKCGTADPISRC